MTATMSARVRQALAVLEDMHSRRLEPGTRQAYLADLSGYPETLVVNALNRCRRELSRFPTMADIIARIEDGHPGPEEAWAMIPKNESDSAVMTAPMRAAYSSAYPLLRMGDEVAARMAFREKYVAELAIARDARRPADWQPSLGHDLAGREIALKQALEQGRLSAVQAAALLPDHQPSTDLKLLVGPQEAGAGTRAKVRELLAGVAKGMPREDKMLATLPIEKRRETERDLSEDEVKARREMLRRQAEGLKEGEGS